MNKDIVQKQNFYGGYTTKELSDVLNKQGVPCDEERLVYVGRGHVVFGGSAGVPAFPMIPRNRSIYVAKRIILSTRRDSFLEIIQWDWNFSIFQKENTNNEFTNLIFKELRSELDNVYVEYDEYLLD